MVKGEGKYDVLVKSTSNRHTGESRYPELVDITGFRVKHGMTKQGKIDFLRGRQIWVSGLSFQHCFATLKQKA